MKLDNVFPSRPINLIKIEDVGPEGKSIKQKIFQDYESHSFVDKRLKGVDFNERI